MKVTIRADSVEIEGYVNAVGRDSRVLTDEYGYPFVEQIAPGAFGKALTEARAKECEVKMLLNHDATHEIGGTGSNLELNEDSIGLHAVATVTDAETVRAAREKRLSGWSFGFRALDWRENGFQDGVERRSITELDLVEVSVIDDRMMPCYAGTSIHARAEGEKIFTRAIVDDAVEYAEDEEKTEDIPEAEPEAEPEEVRAIEDEKPLDFSRYKNQIELLKLGH